MLRRFRVRRNLTSACTRPPTRCLPCSGYRPARRVIGGVRLLLVVQDNRFEPFYYY